MKADAVHVNLVFAWVWILLGFTSGMILGLFFHKDNWLGGYGSFKRRMYRLGHISFFGLGAVNLLYWLTVQKISEVPALMSPASWAFIIGGITMPLCCLIMAHYPKLRMIFAIPVFSLLVGGALTLALLLQAPGQSAAMIAPGNQPLLTKVSP